MIRCLICIFCILVFNECQQINLDVNISQVFIQKISPDMLSWNSRERENNFRYTVTSTEGPDLPPWLYTKYFINNNRLYIFGAPPKTTEIDKIELQISITSLYSYRMKYYKLIISIFPVEEFWNHEIHIRISNVKIEDMLNADLQESLIHIFEDNFWRESKGKLHVTFLAASEDVGFKLPLNPNDTAGVVLHLGSITNFSRILRDLQNETMPLSKHCPSFYKSVTVERFFRPKNFIVDWCSFKLVNREDCYIPTLLSETDTVIESCESTLYNSSDHILKNDEDFLIDKEKIPESPVYGIIIISIIIPSVFVAFVIASWLASFMCLNTTKLNDPYSDDYFETIFFICEDFIRNRNNNEEIPFDEDQYENNEILFNF